MAELPSYQSDRCTDTIFTLNPPYYSPPPGTVPGTYSEPVYSTISPDGLLCVPNANGGSSGYATIMPLTGAVPVTITNGLVGPTGAAAGP